MIVEFNGKTIKKQISEDIELVVRKRNHRYSAIIKNIKNHDMEFSNTYDTIRGLNRYFLTNYDIELKQGF